MGVGRVIFISLDVHRRCFKVFVGLNPPQKFHVFAHLDVFRLIIITFLIFFVMFLVWPVLTVSH